MIKFSLVYCAPVLTAALMLVAATLPATAQFEEFEGEQSCMSNRALQSAIASGEIPPVSDVLEEQGVDPDDVLSVKLCEEGNGALAYFVGVLDRYGEANTLVLPAGGPR